MDMEKNVFGGKPDMTQKADLQRKGSDDEIQPFTQLSYYKLVFYISLSL